MGALLTTDTAITGSHEETFTKIRGKNRMKNLPGSQGEKAG